MFYLSFSLKVKLKLLGIAYKIKKIMKSIKKKKVQSQREIKGIKNCDRQK